MKAPAQVKRRTAVVSGRKVTLIARVLTQYANPYGVRVRVKGDEGRGKFFNWGLLIGREDAVKQGALNAALNAYIEQADAKPKECGGRHRFGHCKTGEHDARFTAKEIAQVVADAAECECLCHRYGVVHVHNGTIYAHDQATWDNLLKRLDPSEVQTVPSYRYKHGDTAETLLARCKAAERLGAAEKALDAAEKGPESARIENDKALAAQEDHTAFSRYLGLQEQAPAEWAVRIEKREGGYWINRCVGTGAFSGIPAGSTFEAAVDALEFLITGWAIGKGIRE